MTWTLPSLISRWICDRDCCGRSAASAASRRAPACSSGMASVVVTRASGRRQVADRRRLPRQPPQHHQAERHQHDRDQLRQRDGVAEVQAAAAIAAEELDDEPRHRVDQHVAPERAAGEGAAALLEEQQAGQDQRLGARLVELRRVQVDVQRRAGVGERERIGEDDAPRHRRLLAVAAAGEEAADPADDVAERDARREHVGRRPHRQLVAADVPQRDDHREDQPAVEDAARLRQRQQLLRIAREEPPVLVEEQQLRADQRADDDPDAQVHHPIAVEAAGAGADRAPAAGRPGSRAPAGGRSCRG